MYFVSLFVIASKPAPSFSVHDGGTGRFFDGLDQKVVNPLILAACVLVAMVCRSAPRKPRHKKTHMKTTYITLGIIGALASASTASTTLVNQLLVNFDGSIAGNVYTLGGGEIDNTGTFVGFGNPAVAGGQSDLIGGGTHQGFNFDPTALGALTTQNWVAEIVVTLDSTTGTLPTLIDVQGDLDLRLNGLLEADYWDGVMGNDTIDLLPVESVQFAAAIVWDATATTLTGYVNGNVFVLGPPADGGVFSTPTSTNVSYGYFGRTGFNDRGIDGQLEAVSFSTFTGTFDPQSDLQLSVVPEPSSTALLGLGGLALMLRRRK